MSLHKHCDLLVAANGGFVSVLALQEVQVVSENVALNLPFTHTRQRPSERTKVHELLNEYQ